MERLILLAIVTLPLYTLGIYVGGSFVSCTHIAAVVLAIIGVLKIANSNFLIPTVACRWMYWFLVFLICGVIGVLTSPFGVAVWTKGIIQFVGLVVTLLMGFTVMHKILFSPDFILTIARSLSLSIALFALVGFLQFLIWNFTPYHNALRFSILNDIAGGIVWGDPGLIGPVFRVNSIAAEPTHYVRFLGLAAGWALIRLGVAGGRLKTGISRVMPLWSAGIILLGFVFSMSINGIFMLICCVAVMLMVYQDGNSRKLSQLFSAFALLVMFLSGVFLLSDGALSEKLGTMSLIYTDMGFNSILDNNNLSALAIASNMEVMVSNLSQNLIFGGGLGSHPLAYEIYAPLYVYDNTILERLNADDAASLFLRLLSETGLLGFFLFIGGFVVLLKRAKQAIVCSMLNDNADVVTRVAISVGLVSSAAGVFALYLLRTGHYYDPMLWVLIALLASVPVILKNMTNERIDC